MRSAAGSPAAGEVVGHGHARQLDDADAGQGGIAQGGHAL